MLLRIHHTVTDLITFPQLVAIKRGALPAAIKRRGQEASHVA